MLWRVVLLNRWSTKVTYSNYKTVILGFQGREGYSWGARELVTNEQSPTALNMAHCLKSCILLTVFSSRGYG